MKACALGGNTAAVKAFIQQRDRMLRVGTSSFNAKVNAAVRKMAYVDRTAEQSAGLARAEAKIQAANEAGGFLMVEPSGC